MAFNGYDLRIGHELVGDSSAAFSSTAIILSVQFEREALEFSSVGNGDLGSLGNVLAKSRIVTSHGSAHADLDGLAGC